MNTTQAAEKYYRVMEQRRIASKKHYVNKIGTMKPELLNDIDAEKRLRYIEERRINSIKFRKKKKEERLAKKALNEQSTQTAKVEQQTDDK
tara:strand:- start:5798 stop:6070 length:273 start_codon:yes stop_codon:yes gene_type:complete